MPVRSLSSSVLKWPDQREVLAGFSVWAQKVNRGRDVVGVGYFGSYAAGREGVGSDLDIVVVLERSSEPFERRGLHFDTTDLPVPSDLVVYTLDEYLRMIHGSSRFGSVLRGETVWIVEPPDGIAIEEKKMKI